MKPGNNTGVVLLATLMAFAAASGNKKITHSMACVEPIVHPLNGALLQLLLCPCTAGHAAAADCRHTMQVRITTRQPVLQKQLVYMEYQLKDAFYIITNTDTVQMVCSERVPGISKTEFIYLASFSTPMADFGGCPARFYLNDTVAGLGGANIALKSLYCHRPSL